ncbi:MAG: fumarate hydratase [Victivallales bacterium]
MNQIILTDKIYELICRTSCEIPEDIESALKKASRKEKKNSPARQQLDIILRNIRLASGKKQPLCQDTGAITFFAGCPRSFDKSSFRKAAESAIIRATTEGYLRKNSVCPLTGKNDGTNVGPGSPMIYWDEKESKNLTVKLLLKGGGSENVGIQYSLPYDALDAGRDVDGIRRCVLDAVFRAQGKGCPPSIISVCIGGDRASGYSEAKKQFMRKIGERNPDPEISKLEKRLLSEINSLGIGPMGLGGGTTALDVFVTALNRVPASYFVTVSQMCWACRRSETKFATGNP